MKGNNTMEIKVKIKDVYGVERIYPACKKSLLFAGLCGTKTLNKSDIEDIKSLGFAVTQELAYKL
jgi:hypothetical protein